MPKKINEDDHEYVDSIQMNVDNVWESEFNKDRFDKGLSDASYYAGFYTALINAGIDDEDAIEILKLKTG